MEEKYLNDLVKHEMGTYLKDYCSSPRNAMILLGGVALNSMGDYLGSTQAIYERGKIDLDDIYLTGTTPEINTITIDICNRDVKKLRKLLNEDKNIKEKLESVASFGEETVLLIDLGNGKYKSFDGMHRIIGHILLGKKIIDAYILKNYGDFLPYNEPHVIYDLIKAFQRSKKTKKDILGLKGALRLLVNNTGNAKDLLLNRFNSSYLKDEQVQDIIKEVIYENA